MPGVEAKRSPHWPHVRAVWLHQNGRCFHCGSRLHLEVHHTVPFHLCRQFELDPDNFVTLCEGPGRECHLHVGHLGNWKTFNPKLIGPAMRRKLRALGIPLQRLLVAA